MRPGNTFTVLCKSSTVYFAGEKSIASIMVDLALRYFLLMTIAALVAGCGVFGSSEGSGAQFDLSTSSYQVGETVEASFINATGGPLYRVQASCADAGLEKLIDGSWIGLHHPDICTAEVSYSRIPEGERTRITMPYTYIDRLIDQEGQSIHATGTFRFRWWIGIDPDFEQGKAVVSASFQIMGE